MSRHIKLNEKDVVVGIDSREQNPFDPEFKNMGFSTKIITMPYGDYTVLSPDLRGILVVERKTLDDFVNCCGVARKRFEHEVIALRGYKYKYIIVEAPTSAIFGKKYRSKIAETCVLGSIARWQQSGISFVFADDRPSAAYITGRLLYFVAKEVAGYACLFLKGLALERKE